MIMMVHIEERGGKMTITAYPSELNFFLNTATTDTAADDAATTNVLYRFEIHPCTYMSMIDTIKSATGGSFAHISTTYMVDYLIWHLASDIYLIDTHAHVW